MPFSGHRSSSFSRKSAKLNAQAIGASFFSEDPACPLPVVDGYIVESFIAVGGEAGIWKAVRATDGMPVALKVPVDDGRAAERVEAEGAALGDLRHPGIVSLIEATEAEDGRPVLVLELVGGTDLARLIPEKGLGFSETVKLFLPVLEAVEYAHSRNFAHRDIKPSNVLISGEGKPKVADFGLAKSMVQADEDLSLTGSGNVAGTVEYLAPERFEPGAAQGRAADVYALGIMFYEMLTGHPPRGSWRRLSAVKKLDVRLDQLMAEATDPDPARRLESAGAFRSRLEEILTARPRYADSPLVTLPVRVADALWTLAGAYGALAGFFSMRRIDGGPAAGIFDLTGGHTPLLGAYVSSFALILIMSGVWLWQACRLLIFRRMPVRESLPIPMGLRWGEGVGSTAIVALAQVMCAWAGLLCAAELFLRSNHWMSSDTPIWEKALCVTAQADLKPVNVWKWEPAVFFRRGFYVIRELQPGLENGSYRDHGKQDFLIFVQPFLMVTGAVVTVGGVLLTLGTLVVQWHRRRRKSLVLVLLLLTAAMGHVASGIHVLARQRGAVLAAAENGLRRQDKRAAWEAARYDNSGQWAKLVRATFGGQGEVADIPDLVAGLFAPQVSHEDKGPMTRLQMEIWLAAEHGNCIRQKRSLENESHGIDQLGDPSSVWYRFEGYDEPEPGRVRGRRLLFRWWGRMTAQPPYLLFDQWDTDATILYQGDALAGDPGVIEGWVRQFYAELSRPGSPDLEHFALPGMMIRSTRDASQWELMSRAVAADAFRRSQERWTSIQFFLLEQPVIRPLAGGRCEVLARTNWMGTRPDGESEQPAKPKIWRLEIAPYKGAWRLLRIDN